MRFGNRPVAIRGDARGGVGDQLLTEVCENGTEGCSGRGGVSRELPCPECFLSGGEDTEGSA